MRIDSGLTIAVSFALLLGSVATAQQTTSSAASNDNATAITSSQSSPSPATDSKIRIVRLSEVQGEVELDRNSGRGFEPALLNLPLVEGTRLRTGGAGFAEVEFEDNSTLRLAPDTQVEFSQLELRPSGTRVSTVKVERGMVYLGLTSSTSNEFTLAFVSNKILLPPSSHVRLDMGNKWANLAVLKGNVHVDAPKGPLTVGKDKTITFNLMSSTEPRLVKTVTPWRYDFWDQAATDYHNRKVKSGSYGNPPDVYGLPDMSYYGKFVDTPDCGQIWRPYFASAAWDPYGNGAWVWYGGSGWSWVSPYPWGWTPYHSGEWEYCPNYGWGWRQRGVRGELRNRHKPVCTPPQRPQPALPHPPLPPAPGSPRVVAVNRKPPVASGLASDDKFIIRRDSAGLGVPRGGLGNLSHVSEHVEHHGSANVAVNSVPMVVGHGAGPGSVVASSQLTSVSRNGSPSYSGGRSTELGGVGRSSSASAAGRETSSGGSMSMSGATAGASAHR